MKKVLLVLVVALLFVACKKENRIERNLWKQGGEWNIDSYQFSSTNNGNPDQNYSETELNFGKLQFDKDGSGSITYQDGTAAYSEKITYTNTEDELTIFDSDGEGVVYQLDWEKNEFTISATETDTYQGFDENFNIITITETYSSVLECSKVK